MKVERAPRGGTLSTLEAGRFFAAFIVVLFHVNVTGSDPKYFGHEPLSSARGGFSGVDFFFVLSGFVIYLGHARDLREGRGLGRFLWKRFQRLYPPLWVLLAVLVAAMAVMPSLRWAGALSIGDVLAAFTIMPYPIERVLAVEWTLRYEILFYALFAACLWRRALGLALWTVLLIASVAAIFVDLSGWAGFFVTPYPLLFAGGVLACRLAGRERPRAALAALLAGLTVFGGRLAYLATGELRPAASVADTLVFGSGATLIIYGLAVLERQGKLHAPGWLRFLGGASYAIYLVHYPALSVGFKIANPLRAQGVPDEVLVCGLIAAAVAAGVVFHLVCEKPLLALTRRLGGNASVATPQPKIVTS